MRGRGFSGAVIVVALLGLGGLLSNAHAVDLDAARELDPHERWMVGAINDARQARGLHRLEVSRSLTRAAADYAEYMRERRHFAHTDQEGRYPYQRAQAADWPTSQVSEVIHHGGSTETVFDGWRGSAPHWKVLMSPFVNHIGMGRDSLTRAYWVGVLSGSCPAGQEVACELTGDTGDSSIPVESPDLFLDVDERWIRPTSRSRVPIRITVYRGARVEEVSSGAAIRARTLKPRQRWRHRLPTGRYVACASQAASARYGIAELCEPFIVPGRLTVRLSPGRPAGRHVAFILRVPSMSVGRPVRLSAAVWARRCVDDMPWVEGPYCWTGWQVFHRRRVAHVKARHRLLVPRREKPMKVTVAIPTVTANGIPYRGARLIRRYPRH